MKFFRFILGLFIIMACSKFNPSVPISSEEIPSPQNIVILFNDSLKLRSLIQLSPQNPFEQSFSISSSSDTTVIPLSENKSFKVNIGYQFLGQILCKPGDTIQINYIKGNQFAYNVLNRKLQYYDTAFYLYNNYMLSPNNYKELNPNLAETEQLIAQFHGKPRKVGPGLMFIPTKAHEIQQDPKGYKRLLTLHFETFKGIDHLLDSLLNDQKIDSAYYTYYQEQNRFSFMQRIQAHYMETKDEYYLQLLQNSFLNDSLLEEKYGFLPTFLDGFITAFILKNESKRTSNGLVFDYPKAYDLLPNYLSGHLLDYARFVCLSKINESNSIEVFNHYAQGFMKNIPDTTLINYVKNNYFWDFQHIKAESAEVYLGNQEKHPFTLKGLLEKHKGKIIYIDFWASWCAPCIQAFPASQALRTNYKNDIVIVYLSLDQNYEHWLNASEKKLKNYPLSYIIVNAKQADFLKELKVSEIPRYLLFDRDGNLVHKNAPGPEGEPIRELLAHYL